ncbi:CoB--CoM heterodisulfide reductase subunit B [Candidatus Bathyarchaeota archaeon]|nr:CoB--CoM heterodisulfide reductase subunit B [Candidatus Bathyarchaeota archaeon]
MEGTNFLKYAFFVGCTTLGRLPGYEKSTRKLAATLGIELVDMPNSSCCGTTYMEGVDELTALSLAARNICIAEDMGLNILTICNGCTETLTKTNKILKENPEKLKKVNEILKDTGREFKGTVEIKHLLRILKEDYGLENLKKAIVKPYKSLKVSTHYGCHLLRPSDVMSYDDPNQPTSMDEIIEITGAKSVQYPGKMDCCGGPIMGIREDVTWAMGLEKIEVVNKYAQALVTSCPFCFISYERAQLMIDNQKKLPIIHLPQILGLSLGLSEEDIGLRDNKIDSSFLKNNLEARK